MVRGVSDDLVDGVADDLVDGVADDLVHADAGDPVREVDARRTERFSRPSGVTDAW